MKWSTLKSRIEDGFAASVQGRVEVWTTRYRTAHDQEGEGWITIDKARIYSTSSPAFYNARANLASIIRADTNLSPLEAWEKAENHLEENAITSRAGFNCALFEYLNLSIEDVLTSDNVIIRALGMLDKRLGKRRLKGLDMQGEKELVRSFHRIRCDLEGIRLETMAFD